MLWENFFQVWTPWHMGVRFLVFRASFPSFKSTWPIHNPSHDPFIGVLTCRNDGLFLLRVSKHFLQALRLFFQSISSHYRPVSSLALCWSILFHGLSFSHALSHFPAPSLFVNSLCIPDSLISPRHRRSLLLATLTHVLEKTSPHSLPSPFDYQSRSQDPNTSQDAWSGPQEGSITRLRCLSKNCICVFSQSVENLIFVP